MKAYPQTLFIGLIELSSILLPGLALTYAAEARMETVLKRIGFGHGISSAEYWPVFFITSFFAGHLVYLIGAKLDELIYDRLRNATPWQQGMRRAVGTHEASIVTRIVSRMLFGPHADLPLIQVLDLKKRSVPDIRGQVVLTPFQWCKARLTLAHPDAATEVQRLEAEAKFFRSFSIVLIFLVALLIWRALRGFIDVPAIGLVCVFLILALWRYLERRFKAAQQAYWFVITLDAHPNGEGPGANH